MEVIAIELVKASSAYPKSFSREDGGNGLLRKAGQEMPDKGDPVTMEELLIFFTTGGYRNQAPGGPVFSSAFATLGPPQRLAHQARSQPHRNVRKFGRTAVQLC